MSEFIVPPLAGDGVWPSLGAQVADWQEASLVFGPGDLLGRPYVLDDEDRAYLERAYQVYPPDHTGPCRFDASGAGWRCTRGAGRCGRRRFQTVVIMTRKGTKKSERLASVAAAELADDAPVRCDGFRREGGLWVPIGRPVTSPFVFLFAFAKEQAEDTSWDAMRTMIEQGPGAERYIVWEDRILRREGVGEAKPLASAPDSRDGGKTTFQGKEEGHRWTLPRHKEAHRTTVGNLSKRPIAEPWELHATTMYAPGEMSVVEELHEGAKKLTGDAAKASRMFFFYRWADARIKIQTPDGAYDLPELKRAIVDASGPVVAGWSDIDDIASRQFLEPGSDANYAERVWLNRPKKRAELAFDAERWKANAAKVKGYLIPKGARVVAGFDGSRGSVNPDPSNPPDHTGLVITEIATGHQQKYGHWDPMDYGGMIPEDVVDIAVDDLFATYDVWRLYCDPPGWRERIVVWQGKYGKDRVVEWFMWRERPVGFAMRNYADAIDSGACTNDGDPEFTAHIGRAHRRLLNARDDHAERLWTIEKERDGSPLKIDLAAAGGLSWEARSDATALGVPTKFRSNYSDSGLTFAGS